MPPASWSAAVRVGTKQMIRRLSFSWRMLRTRVAASSAVDSLRWRPLRPLDSAWEYWLRRAGSRCCSRTASGGVRLPGMFMLSRWASRWTSQVPWSTT